MCSVVLTLLAVSGRVGGAERANIIVAQDGSGDFRTIQEAIHSVPANNTENIIILIRKGTYNEKLYIQKSNIALVGEDRDSTRIVYAELRKKWLETHLGEDSGAAVINITGNAADIVLANLTVYNNYGALYGDHDHQFAIRSGDNSTKIIILNCNIMADGGDTISLWNGTTGMYYHANCYFMGWLDYVCPRGWCYITDSRFYGFNTASAGLWHDGSKAKDQKFVIRNSTIDGVRGFPLGRNHRDAQFYLLDCRFTSSMADRPIYPAFAPSSHQWGQRYYYHNCHREGGDYIWFADNLCQAEGAPRTRDITVAWTFGGL